MRRLLPVLVAGLLALAGLAALAVGIALRTVWLPADEVTSAARITGSAPLAVTAPGVLELRDLPVEISATAPAGTPVLLAIGREDDVAAWVGEAAHVVLTGLEAPGAFAVEPVDGEAAVPNPAGSDLWVQQATGTGSASLTYDRDDGRWLLLAATDGTAPAPAQITMTWPREVSAPWSVPLLAAGLVLLVLAVVVLVYGSSRRPGAHAAAGTPTEEVRS